MGKVYQAEIFFVPQASKFWAYRRGYKYENNSFNILLITFDLRLSEQMMNLEIFSILFKKL